MLQRPSLFCVSRDHPYHPYVPCSVFLGGFSNLDQLLSIDIGHLRQSVVPSFLEGCCSVATQLGDVRSSWFIAQLQKARRFPDLSALKVLLTNAQLFASLPTIEFVNEFKEVSNYLCILRGTVEKDELDESVYSQC